MDTFAHIAREREHLADLGDSLTEEQWDQRSLAGEWRVREVFAHLTMPFRVRMPAMVVGMIRNLGNFDRYADQWARGEAAASEPADLVAALRRHARSRFTPPGMGPEVPLTDLVVHGIDIRHPLGEPQPDRDAEALRLILDALASKKGSVFGVSKAAFSVTRYVATDLDWSHGTGPEAAGLAIDVIGHLCRGLPLPGSTQG